MLYAASVRSQIVKENPDMSVPEVMKEQSVWWKALSETQRQPWDEKSAAARVKYEKKLEKYQKTDDYQKFILDRDAYKAEMVNKRNKLMGIKTKRKRSHSDGKGEKKSKIAKRSSSVSRAKTPKKPRSSSARRKRTSRRSSSRSAPRRSASKRSRRSR